MPIRTLPLDAITEKTLQDMQQRRIAEGSSLEYKEAMAFDDDSKFELLKDVSAFANAGGGAIVYGVREGAGEDRGLIEALPGISDYGDEVIHRIEQIVSDGLDERLSGLQLHGFSRSGGGGFLLLRVPTSPLAPHMIRGKTTKPRFYLRGTVSSQPMNASQIKEVAVRLQGAEDRAVMWIAERTANVMQVRPSPDPGQAFLHIVPLLASPHAVDLGSREVLDRLKEVPLMGAQGVLGASRLTLQGFQGEYAGNTPMGYGLLVTRRGAIEWQEPDIAQPSDGDKSVFWAWDFEDGVLAALQSARRLTDAGLLALPALVSLQLFGLSKCSLKAPQGISQRWYGLPAPNEIRLDPWVVNEWGGTSDLETRRMFDVLWQAFGFERSWGYGDDGKRRQRPRI